MPGIDNFCQKNTMTADQILSVIPGNLYCKDINGLYTGGNHEIVRTLRLDSVSQLVGQNDIQLMGMPWAEQIMENDKNIILCKTGKILIENSFDINGKKAIYLSKKCPLYNSSDVLIGVIGISLDITKKKQQKLFGIYYR